MDFNTWKQFYEWGFCTKEQLQEAVDGGMLTQEQYNEIVGTQDSTPVQETIPTPAPVVQSAPTPTPVQEPTNIPVQKPAHTSVEQSSTTTNAQATPVNNNSKVEDNEKTTVQNTNVKAENSPQNAEPVVKSVTENK